MSQRIHKCPKQKRSGTKKENKAKAEENIMKTNMKENNMNELNLNELEQASGGILPILIGLGTLALGGVIIAVMPDKKK